MDWYYAKDNQRTGPVSEAELQSLVSDGAITTATLVWTQGMANWQRYGETAAANVPDGQRRCIECGRTFPEDDMVCYTGSHVCAACKPVFFQRIREGGALPGRLHFAGFWIRFGAVIVDALVLGIPCGIIALMAAPKVSDTESFVTFMRIIQLPVAVAAIAYETWMIGAYGATLGKMACGIKVVRPDGGRITYPRAFARYWAKRLSGIVLCAGYLMAALDHEKRGLHDHLCDTRVIRT